MDQVISNLLAAFALIISIFTYFSLRKQLRGESERSAREIELLRIQIEKEYRAKKQEERCEIFANMYRSGNGHKVRVGNGGPSKARNVNLVISEESMIIASEVSRKFPMSIMDRGQSVDLIATVTMGSPSKEDIEVHWTNDDGSIASKTITITH